MTVRAATPADAPEIAALEAAAAHQPWTEAQIRGSLASPSTRGWVTLGRDGAVAGHLLASCVAEEGEILTLAVDPGQRRQGFGRRLLDACLDAWREAGVRCAWLEVREDNVGARRLYAGTGWAEAGARRRYYQDGTDAVVMRWSGETTT